MNGNVRPILEEALSKEEEKLSLFPFRSKISPRCQTANTSLRFTGETDLRDYFGIGGDLALLPIFFRLAFSILRLEVLFLGTFFTLCS